MSVKNSTLPDYGTIKFEHLKIILSIPGMPVESFFWPGGKLPQDHGIVIYDVNHLKVRDGSLDAAIIAAKLLSEKKKKPINFGQFDFITDAVNLQKLFAFCQKVKNPLVTSTISSRALIIGHVAETSTFGKPNSPKA
ncbi:hypothetical protein RB195_018889 [Necator americanus]|uniref:Uncharacterized protein n=1 Tax=Necator americanus TaxID=51031 RepID=A0ABR1CBP4_NECAM